jgi:subtilase family serine protease
MSLQFRKPGAKSKPTARPTRLTSVIMKFSLALSVLAVTLGVSSRFAARVLGASGDRVTITRPVDENRTVRLVGNTRPEASPENDRGLLPDSFAVDHMLLQLKRHPQAEREFTQYINSLTDKTSPNFRQWMMPDEQGEKYGLTQPDIDAVTNWLQSHGFDVGYVYPNRMVIDFSGTAGQIREAFHTEIHQLEVNGEQHFANMSDPQIPVALAPAIEGVVSMHNFKPHPHYQIAPDYTFSGCTFGVCLNLVPADLQAIYTVSPLLTAGINGKGMTVVAVEDSDAYANDWTVYQSTFGLKSYGGTFTTEHPNTSGNCTDPGTNGADIEADLDVEMITAIAPAAHVVLASCKDGGSNATVGELLAVENLLAAGNPPPIISMSYGECEVKSGAAANTAFNSAFQSAAAAGVSVFVSSGDTGASLCTQRQPSEKYSLPGIGVNGWGETVYNVSVGGTDFEDMYFYKKAGYSLSHYWNATNSVTYGSAKNYIPEIPWNSSCAGYLLYSLFGYASASAFCSSTTGQQFLSTAAGSGGPSNCAKGAGNSTYGYVEDTTCTGWSKPSWQAGIFGNPADGVRDVPDVSLFAANGVWGHSLTICASDTKSGGKACKGAPSGWVGIGGTSAAAPMMAAIQALVDEKWKIRAGNPNPTYYSIARKEFGASGNKTCYAIDQTPGVASSCVFYDVTTGDNNVDCAHNGPGYQADCYVPSGTYGSLSTQAIGSLNLLAAGSGYTSNPTCTIAAPANKSKYLNPTGGVIYAGGTQATCTATINTTTHVVSAVKLTNGGQGYSGVPLCMISGGSGKSAICMAVISPTKAPTAYQPSFGAAPGWDMATGIGSVNAYNLVFDSAW